MFENKASAMATRAWNFVRLTVFRASRKAIIKNLRLNRRAQDDMYYRERQFSFEDTPLFTHSKRSRSMRFFLSSIPCVNDSTVDFFPEGKGYDGYYAVEDDEVVVVDNVVLKGVDAKAEVFIMRFYEQQKLERSSFMNYIT